MNLRRFMPAPTRSGDRILTAQLIAWLGHRDIGQCLRWVNRTILTARRSLPVYPDKQTILEPIGSSHSCQYQKRGCRSITSGSVLAIGLVLIAASEA